MIPRSLTLFLVILSVAAKLASADDAANATRPLKNEKSARTLLELSRNGGIENNLSGKCAKIEERKVKGRVSDEHEPKEEDLIEAADYGIKAMNELYYVKEPKLYEMGLYLTPNNPARFVAAFNDQSEEARQLAKFGYAALKAATKFRSKFPDMLRQASLPHSTERSPLRQACPKKGIPQCTPASLRYRTTDGSCNNLKELWWGSSMSPMQRFLPAFYEDNIESVRKSVTGADLPSARQISDYVHEERDAPLVSITHMLMQWGQFIDHDITATGQSTAFNGSVPQCCLGDSRGVQPPEFLHPECLPIIVPADDSRLSHLGVRCMEFVRSGPVPREDCEFGTREQLSQVTSFIDASTVYSSTARQGDSLRIFRNGLMQYGKLQSRRPVLPREEESDLCKLGSLSTNCFKAGDARLSEQPALISLHVVFLRLHNRLATRMSALNQHWGDEKVFQETRKIVGAIVQHITYREFLPIVLGHDVMRVFDIELLRKGYYEGYDQTVNPSIANEFSAAAFRFGHSLVQSSFVRFDSNHQPMSNNVSVHEEFMHPANLESPGSVDRLLLGLVNQPAQKRDEFISDELTNHLFQTPGFPFGMDLASINIQRGRDHGIPPFVEYRVSCGLSPIRDWIDLERIMAPSTARKFRDLYATVEDIDLFSGGLAEKSVSGGLVGPTFACIIAQQFRNFRKGDRFWYENPFLENGFTVDQLQQIRRVTLAQILCKTMENIDSIQPFVMLAPDNIRNQRLPCNNEVLEEIDLRAWIEKPRRRSVDVDIDQVIESPESIKDAQSRAAAKKNPANQRSPQRQKPTKTRISQHNRIAVKRPLGPHENLTIVVTNNAVNAPIILTDSVYGSNLQINRYPGVNQRPTRPNDNPSYDPSSQLPNPYYPHNYQDPNNPNPPNYGLSPKPMNDYFPNNQFFAYTSGTPPSQPPTLDQNVDYQNQNQQYSYFSTPRPATTQRPYQQQQQQSTYQTTRAPRPSYNKPTVTTTRRSYPDYDQGSDRPSNRPAVNYPTQPSGNQNPYANFEPNSSDRDENNPNYNNPRPTKRPKQPYQQPMSNRRYPEPTTTTTKPQSNKTRPTNKRPASNSAGSGYGNHQPTRQTTSKPYTTKWQVTSKPQSTYHNFPSSTVKPQSYNLHSGVVHKEEEANHHHHHHQSIDKGDNSEQQKPHYLHTHTTISDVPYVTQDNKRPWIKTHPELPRPISWLQNRASLAGSIVESSASDGGARVTNASQMVEAKVAVDEETTTDSLVSDGEDLTTLSSSGGGDSVEEINDALVQPVIESVETLDENGNDPNVSHELPRPINVRHGS